MFSLHQILSGPIYVHRKSQGNSVNINRTFLTMSSQILSVMKDNDVDSLKMLQYFIKAPVKMWKKYLMGPHHHTRFVLYKAMLFFLSFDLTCKPKYM